MTITAIVVAFAATAMAIALVSRLVKAGGRATMSSESPENANADGGNS
jgi:multicomponent Na+:H+ antiporter subunit C